MTRQWIHRIPAVTLFVLALIGPGASAQVDPVQIYPLPGGHEWTAILGAANMDGDPADEIVVVNLDNHLVIVDSATGEIQFDSAPYGWPAIHAPGWNREIPEDFHRNHGYDIFCDEDGDGIFCVHMIVEVTNYEDRLAVICLDRNAASAPSPPSTSKLHLRPNYPNPIGPSTRIDFSLAAAGHALVQVYDAEGRLVRVLLDEELTPGDHSVVWDGRNDAGRSVASGTYYYVLEAGGSRAARKSLVLR
jgi:hypothetical protein